ncbi:hypothetical protein M3Y99_01025300 [Aphelenchoides fujianensis]|nr:hypothetical protein M3Y99_01025300 [Aphelenchoides fujianensis]
MPRLGKLLPLVLLDVLLVLFFGLVLKDVAAQPQVDGTTLVPSTVQTTTARIDPVPTNITIPCVERCKDRYSSCQTRKRYCELPMYHRMMVKACPMSCGRCVDKGDCFDMRRHCRRSQCTKEGYTHLMKEGCQKTCRYCIPFTCAESANSGALPQIPAPKRP